MEMASLSAARPANVVLGFPLKAIIPTNDSIKLCSRASSVSSRLRFQETPVPFLEHVRHQLLDYTWLGQWHSK